MKRVLTIGKTYLDANGARVWEYQAEGVHVIRHDPALPINL